MLSLTCQCLMYSFSKPLIFSFYTTYATFQFFKWEKQRSLKSLNNSTERKYRAQPKITVLCLTLCKSRPHRLSLWGDLSRALWVHIQPERIRFRLPCFHPSSSREVRELSVTVLTSDSSQFVLLPQGLHHLSFHMSYTSVEIILGFWKHFKTIHI